MKGTGEKRIIAMKFYTMGVYSLLGYYLRKIQVSDGLELVLRELTICDSLIQLTRTLHSVPFSLSLSLSSLGR